MARRRLKQLKMMELQEHCPLCKEPLPERGAVLDRARAVDACTPDDTPLIHATCDVSYRAAKGYTEDGLQPQSTECGHVASKMHLRTRRIAVDI
jgi:hypothetical protein